MGGVHDVRSPSSHGANVAVAVRRGLERAYDGGSDGDDAPARFARLSDRACRPIRNGEAFVERRFVRLGTRDAAVQRDRGDIYAAAIQPIPVRARRSFDMLGEETFRRHNHTQWAAPTCADTA